MAASPELQRRVGHRLQEVHLLRLLRLHARGHLVVARGLRRGWVAGLADPERHRGDRLLRGEQRPVGLVAVPPVVVDRVEVRLRSGERCLEGADACGRVGPGNGDRHRYGVEERVADVGDQVAGPGDRLGVVRVELVAHLDERDAAVAGVRREEVVGPLLRAGDVGVLVLVQPVEERQLDGEAAGSRRCRRARSAC